MSLVSPLEQGVWRRAARAATASSRGCSSRGPGNGGQCAGERTGQTGDTFAEQFGTGKIGMMGTGNFNIVLARDQMRGPPVRLRHQACCRAWSRARRPRSSGATSSSSLNGSKRVDDAVDFMKLLLSQEHPATEIYAKNLNLTTRSDMADNEYFKAEPLVQDVAKALAVGRTPYTLTFFEQVSQLPPGALAADVAEGVLHRRGSRTRSSRTRRRR